jgi:hypothetical protein
MKGKEWKGYHKFDLPELSLMDHIYSYLFALVVGILILWLIF